MCGQRGGAGRHECRQGQADADAGEQHPAEHLAGVVGAKAHREQAIGFIRGYIAGLDWLYDPANKAAAIDILRRNIATMTPELAEKTYGVLLDAKTGLLKKARLDLPGIKTVLALRSEYGEPKKTLDNPRKYIDLTWYKKALAK